MADTETQSPEKQFAYDVAFSFLARDEPLAAELNDLLQDRLSTFFFPKQQEKLAGTDGQEKFTEVFGKEARLVVVLYRAGWGETPWTRIEQTAIRNRGYYHGFDFTKFVPLDDPPTVPEWVPRAHLWMDHKRWGSLGIAGFIHARAQELGATGREETVLERAARLQRTIDFRKRRHAFLNSTQGVESVDKEFEALTAEIEKTIADLASFNGLNFRVGKTGRSVVLFGTQLSASLEWTHRYVNTLNDAALTLTYLDGPAALPGQWQFEKPRQIERVKLIPDLSSSDSLVWVGGPLVTGRSSAELASFIVKRLMDHEHDRGK